MTLASPECVECGGAGWVFLDAVNEYGTVVGVEASCPACFGRPESAVRDWREANHWSPRPSPCWCCGRPTNLRDDRLRPAHKLCAELVAADPATAPVEQGVAR